jgi:hypothetical protein
MNTDNAGSCEPSEATDESSPVIGEALEIISEPSAMTVDPSPMTDETSTMTGDTSTMIDETSAVIEASHDDIIGRVEARITDEIPAPHSFICRRPMLRLHAAQHEKNLLAFQSRWQKGEVSQDMLGYNVFYGDIKEITLVRWGYWLIRRIMVFARILSHSIFLLTDFHFLSACSCEWCT